MIGNLIGVLLGSPWSRPACAESQSPETTFQPPPLEEIVVTAQRRDEDIQNVPASVQAISAKQIESLGIKESTDIGQFVSNVNIALPFGDGNHPIITIRGIGLNDYNTNNPGPNGVYVDDVYISAPSAQTFPVFDLKQIEVLKGPQGTLYGRNTSGGALIFRPNTPTHRFTTDLRLEYSSFNTKQIDGAVGGAIAANLDGRLALVYNRSDGYMHNSFDNEPASGANNAAFRLQLLYRPVDQMKVAFSSTYGYVDNLPTEYRHIGTFAPGTQGSAVPTVCPVARAYAGGCVDLFGFGTPANFFGGAFSRMQNLRITNLIEAVRVDYTLGSISLTSITAYQYSDKFQPDDSDASPNSLLRGTFGVRSNTYTEEIRAARTEKSYSWQAGLYYLHEGLDQNQPLSLFYDGDRFGGFGLPPGLGAFDGLAEIAVDQSHQVTDSAAIYGQGDYSLDNLALTAGARLTREHKSFDYFGGTRFQQGGLGMYGPLTDAVTDSEVQRVVNFMWRAALSYHFSPSTMVYASSATGFKSGDFNGGFLSNVPAQALLQLKPVAPERVTAYEIGVKSSFFGRHLVVAAAAFYNRYNDMQIFTIVPQIVNTTVGPVLYATNLLANAQRAHTEGVELQVTAAPIRGLTINLEPAWLNAKIDHAGLVEFTGSVPLDGKQLANAPHFSFSGTLGYSLPASIDGDHIDLQFNSNYKGQQFFDTTDDPYIQQDAYWIHNASLSYRSHAGWELGAFVNNLTNSQYFVTNFNLTNPFGVLTGVVGMPRQFGVRFSYHD